MREIKINGKIYTIKFTHKAAKCQNCVQSVFELVTGTTMMGNLPTDSEPTISDIINSVGMQVAKIPSLCDTLMFAGLKAENPVETEEEAGDLLITYMEETGKNYAEIFESFKECMTEDGFFKIAGIEDMIQTMNKSMKEDEAIQAETAQGKSETKKKKASDQKE